MYMKQIKRGTVHEVKIITHNFVCRKNNLPLVILKKKTTIPNGLCPTPLNEKTEGLPNE